MNRLEPQHPTCSHPADYRVETHPWGELVWMVSGALGTSEKLTVGRCYINPGQANPRHYHPNCDEVLYVLRGTIEHTVDDDAFPMQAGDTVSIPSGSYHNARNVGTEVAEFVITFDAADRRTVGE
ncbi:MAG: cupin domain-containing protein [Mycobacteriales bacterium]